ncbi:MAG TPA: tetratricopeptide repeat protein [Terriglobus sp.]
MSVRNAKLNLLINCSWDWHTAERACQQAADSGRMNARTAQLYANLMNCMGRHHDAVTLALHGYRRDSSCDLVSGQVALAYFYAGDYANAKEFIQRTRTLQPQYLFGYALNGRVSVELGQWQEAICSFRQGLEMAGNPAFLKALLSYAYLCAGDEDRARELLRGLEEESHDACFPAYDVAAVYARLGQEKDSLHNICRAYAMRDIKTAYIDHDPRFARLRNSTGFQQVMAALGSGRAPLFSV